MKILRWISVQRCASNLHATCKGTFELVRFPEHRHNKQSGWWRSQYRCVSSVERSRLYLLSLVRGIRTDTVVLVSRNFLPDLSLSLLCDLLGIRSSSSKQKLSHMKCVPSGAGSICSCLLLTIKWESSISQALFKVGRDRLPVTNKRQARFQKKVDESQSCFFLESESDSRQWPSHAWALSPI